MRTAIRRSMLAAAVGAALAALTPPAAAQESTAIGEMLRIMKSQGMIDDAGETKVLALYAADQRQRATPQWLEGFEWGADFRGRFDGTYFDRDELGGEAPHRGRGRYRARLGFTKRVGSWARLGVRLTSSAVSGSNPSGDRRSGNVSFGESGNDEFSPDTIFFDRAFASFALHDSEAAQTQLTLGRAANPFSSSRYPGEILLFDNDINPEGIYLSSSFRANEGTRLHGALGAFIVKEVPGGSDPKLFGAQVGIETRLARGLSIGIRTSAYEWHAIDGDQGGTLVPAGSSTFFSTALATGNLPSAVNLKHPKRMRLGEASAFLQLDALGPWPLLLYATAVKNFSADAAFLSVDPDGAGPLAAGLSYPEENVAYGVGFEFGDSAKFLRIGGGYFRVEANAVLGQFTDSDLFEGFTNRHGWMFFASRRLNPNIELRLTFFDSRELKDRGLGAGPFAASLRNSDRTRILADAIVSF